MKIKSIAAVIIILSLLTVPCVSGCLYPVSGSGDLITEQFDYTDFSRVQVSNVFEFEISQSDTYSISVTADDNIMEYIIIDRSGDTLQVRLKQGYTYRSITAIAKIGMPDISRLEMSGATTGVINDFNTSNNISIEVSGASKLELLDFTAGNIKMKVSGASVVDAKMTGGNTEFEISGASKMTGLLACGDAEFNVSGASSLNLSGSGQDLKATVSGASKMSLDNFTTDDADVSVSGASTAVVNTVSRLDADVSGASTLYYIGNPVLGDIDVSGASSVKKK